MSGIIGSIEDRRRMACPRREMVPTARTMDAIRTVLLWLLGASLLSGCGASALRQHLSAARVLTIAHASIASTVEAVVEAQSAECEQRPEAERAACAAALAEVATPVATAVDGLGAGVVGYREAAVAAAEIDSGEAALPALGRMLAGLLESALPAIVAALERWGVDVPPEVATYAAAAAGILRAVAGGGR